MQSSNSEMYDFASMTFSWLSKLAVIIFVILNLVWLFSKKSSKIPDVQTRMLRKFHFTNFELLPHLNSDERKEMIQVLQNTITNAELFKSKDSTANIGTKLKKQNKTPARKVHFKI